MLDGFRKEECEFNRENSVNETFFNQQSRLITFVINKKSSSTCKGHLIHKALKNKFSRILWTSFPPRACLACLGGPGLCWAVCWCSSPWWCSGEPASDWSIQPTLSSHWSGCCARGNRSRRRRSRSKTGETGGNTLQDRLQGPLSIKRCYNSSNSKVRES